jgi:dUTP pyrophosphatase
MHKSFVMPGRATEKSACFDLRCWMDEPIDLAPLERALVPLGCAVEFSEDFELQLRPRSGLSFKNGITLINSPACIDSDYRGEIKASMINMSNDVFTIEPGMRICQAGLVRLVSTNFEEVGALSDSERGSDGFGSSGLK